MGLPVSVIALDGKVTALPTLNHPLVQNQHPENGLPYGLVRTVTCSLVSAAGRPCLDAIPIPADTNEVGWFQTAFRSVVETHGGLFDLVTYDAGGFSRANADAVIAAGKDYLFALEDEHRAMCGLAVELLAAETVIAPTEDVLDNETTVVRSLRLLRADPSWSYGDGKTPEELVWGHAKAFLSVEYVKVKQALWSRGTSGCSCRATTRSGSRPRSGSCSSAATGASRNNNHRKLDTAFAEDDRPWIEADANGMLAVLLLRRIAYTLLALFRAASRTDEGRAIRWRALLAWEARRLRRGA